MKKTKQAAAFGMAFLMAGAASFGAFAASPEFARTAEEWERLRDNVLEYGEIEDLIAEYNATVQTNQMSLNEFKREYGDTKDDVSQKYRDMADEIYSSLSYPDSDDPTYGMTVASVLMAEIQADNLVKQADDNLEDSEIIYLNYKQAEKTLVTVAQTNMIGYQKGLLEIQNAEIARDQAQTALNSVQTKAAVGMATQADVLSAKEALMTAERNVESARAGQENLRQKLQVMLGWQYNASPEIQPVPAADGNRISAMNPQADLEKALENNYALQVNKKKLANATASSDKESISRTIADNEQKIASALVSGYQNVLAAKLSYDQAAAELQLEQRNLQSLEVQFQQGNASKNQLESQQQTVRMKELALQTADLNLFQTMETYDWSVNGLASVS